MATGRFGLLPWLYRHPSLGRIYTRSLKGLPQHPAHSFPLPVPFRPMNHLVNGSRSLVRNVIHCVSRSYVASPFITSASFVFQLVARISIPLLGTRFAPSLEKERIDGATFSGDILYADLPSNPFVVELSVFFGAPITPKIMDKVLNDLQGCLWLTRLELRAPHLEANDWQRMVAVHALSGAVVQMSLLAHLALSENFVTEIFLLHISTLPRLETLTIFPAPLVDNLSGEESRGFNSLRSLDLPNEGLLRRFLSYPLQDLEALRVGNLGGNSLQLIARSLTGLQQLHIEGSSLSSPEIFALRACFRLEVVKICTDHPLEMDDLDLHRFRAMFRNLRSLSIEARGF